MAVGGRGPDPTRLYLNEIGQHDLLTAEEERRLGKLIKDGQAAVQRFSDTDTLPSAKR